MGILSDFFCKVLGHKIVYIPPGVVKVGWNSDIHVRGFHTCFRCRKIFTLKETKEIEKSKDLVENKLDD